jgi:hypothetical protein
MSIADYQIGLLSKTDTFNFFRPRNRLTPEEEERFLREQCAVQERRRRDWAKRRRAAQRRRGANRHHPARDREALSRLRSAVSSTDHEHAPDIAKKLADCVARKSRCRLWICSRCSSERSQQQVERLVGNLADHDHSELAAFTVILGAIGLNGAASAEAAATEARRQIERLRQHAKRSGLDVGYWAQTEIKVVRPSEFDESDHIAETLADLNRSSLEFSAVLVPHCHGIVRMSRTTINRVRQFFQAVFPSRRQVVVKGLHEDQTTANAVSIWASYSTKAEVKTKRKEPREWFADMPSGDELMIVSIFQKSLKYRGGRFAYHLQLPEIIHADHSDLWDYESWLYSRYLTCRDDRLRESYKIELDSISARFILERKSHYKLKQEGGSDDKTRKRTSPSDRTRRSDIFDSSIFDEPISRREGLDLQRCQPSDLLLQRPGISSERMVIHSPTCQMGHKDCVGHTCADRRISNGRTRPCGRGTADLPDATPGDVETDMRGGRMLDHGVGPALAAEYPRVQRRCADRRRNVDRHGRRVRQGTTGPPD